MAGREDEQRLVVADGDPLDGVRFWLKGCSREALEEALVDVIARLGYDEDGVFRDDEQVSGADFISSVQHTYVNILGIQLP